MRVLHVVNYAWPHFDGYVARTLGLVTAQQKVLGYDVALAVSPFGSFSKVVDEEFVTPKWGPRQQIIASASGKDGPLIGPTAWERPRLGLSPRTSKIFYDELSSIVRRLEPDIVHVHHPHYVAEVAIDVAHAQGVPVVYEVRCFNGDYEKGTQLGDVLGDLVNRNEYKQARRADAVVTIADGLANRLLDNGVEKDKLSVVRNSVNTEFFKRAKRQSTPGVIRVAYATTFEEIENLEVLVRAALAANEEIKKKLELTIAGTGRDFERIKALVETLDPEGQVITLPGHISFKEMPQFYAGLDLFVVPRKAAAVAQHTTPLKPLEAIATGLPLLSTNLPALRELLDGREGVRFCEPEVEEMKAALVEFATNPWETGGGIEDRSWSSEVRRYEPIYQDLLSLKKEARGERGQAWKKIKMSGLRRFVSLRDSGALKAIGVQPIETHLVICGFPRAGSTLLQLILRTCIKDIDGPPFECAAMDVALHNHYRKRTLVTKLPADIHAVEELRDYYKGKKAKLRIIVTVRDPRSVLTSKHSAYPSFRGYYVDPKRWVEIYRVIKDLENDADVYLLKFEDLLTDPQRIQAELTQFADLDVREDFEHYHTLAEKESRDSMTEGALGGLRSLDRRVVDKWRDEKHSERISELIEELPEFAEACLHFGYEKDNSWIEPYTPTER